MRVPAKRMKTIGMLNCRPNQRIKRIRRIKKRGLSIVSEWVACRLTAKWLSSC